MYENMFELQKILLRAIADRPDAPEIRATIYHEIGLAAVAAEFDLNLSDFEPGPTPLRSTLMGRTTDDRMTERYPRSDHSERARQARLEGYEPNPCQECDSYTVREQDDGRRICQTCGTEQATT